MDNAADREFRSIWTDLYQVSFRQGWINAGGIRTRYVEAGSVGAPVVIMLHGNGGSWETFCRNLGPHAEHFHCFAFDMVGGGFTDKPDYDYEILNYLEHVLKFMEAVGVHRASLLGVSLGAWVAVRLAANHPDKVDKLTLLAPAGVFANAANMDRIRSQREEVVNNPSWASMQAIFNSMIVDPKNRIDDLLAIRRAMYLLPEMKGAMNHILCLQEQETRRRNLLSEAEWRSIKAETLIIGAIDKKDEYLETAQIIRNLIPRARYEEIRKVNHWAHFEEAEIFNRLNIPFLLGK